MKLGATFLLLFASSLCLYERCEARVQALPLDLLKPLPEKVLAKEDLDQDLVVPLEKDVVEEDLNSNVPVPIDFLKPLPEKDVVEDVLDQDVVEPLPDKLVVEEDLDQDVIEPLDFLKPLPEKDVEEEDLDEYVELPDYSIEDELHEESIEIDVSSEARAGDCVISIRRGLPKPQPVYLKTNSEEFYPYSDTGSMVVNQGQTLQMWCPSEFQSIDSKLLTATCVRGSSFRVNDRIYDIRELACNSWPGFSAQKTGENCNGGIMVRVGFPITSERFAKQMEICFNEDVEVTRYVHHKLSPASDYFQSGVPRLNFQNAGFFGRKNVNRLYTQKMQQQTISKELGMNVDKYFQTRRNIYLSRGHMGAKADFVYADQQRATFLFINAAPQWQVFNAGNWLKVEDGLRRYVSRTKKHVDCYTGVWGVTTLPNSRGVETPLYLAHDNNNNGLIPVPKIYFRVVIEPSTGKGIVLVGVNNPHLTLEQINREYILCDDVSDRIDYIKWRKHDITAGYSYACEVSEFTRRVTHLPNLSAPGGLLI